MNNKIVQGNTVLGVEGTAVEGNPEAEQELAECETIANDILEKLDREVSKTRSTMKSLNYETSTIRIDFSKLLETYEKQRKLVASLEEDIHSKKLETNVDVSQEIMTFLDKYAN